MQTVTTRAVQRGGFVEPPLSCRLLDCSRGANGPERDTAAAAAPSHEPAGEIFGARDQVDAIRQRQLLFAPQVWVGRFGPTRGGRETNAPVIVLRAHWG